MSPCLVRGGGGATTYMLESLDLESIKSPSSTTTTSWISNSTASPSSESGSPVAVVVSTRKPRTPRKRPNQTYNEAAALLATAYPKIFSPPINNTNNSYFTKPPFSYEPDLLLDSSAHGLSLHRPNYSGPNNLCEKAPFELDFDAESIILDGEELMGEGIDCIMGNNFTANHHHDGSNGNMEIEMEMQGGFCYGYPVGLGFQIGEIGMRKETMRAIRNGDKEGDWWRFPTVNAIDSAAEKRRKKKAVVVVEAEEEEEFVVPRLNAELLLKLNHDAVLEAWTNKASPISDDVTVAGSDVQARLAQIDLFGGMREASVLRYKEKRQNRLFSKKIRYQVRKVNADRRPRMKGRFVRTQNSKYSDG